MGKNKIEQSEEDWKFQGRVFAILSRMSRVGFFYAMASSDFTLHGSISSLKSQTGFSHS